MPPFSLPMREEQPEVPLYAGDLACDLRIVGRNGLAEEITGGLSAPGKMPCPAWGIPATRCRIGAVLAQREGTVCNDCYALKRNYRRESVQKKLEERYQGLFNPLWTPAMIYLVSYHCDEYFRWFDSGDLQGENHLKNIVRIAEELPDVKMWLPTREVQTVRSVIAELGVLPENLIVRVSANMIDGAVPRGFQYRSVVVSHPEDATCIAQQQRNKCDGPVGHCRACWEDPVVRYPLH